MKNRKLFSFKNYFLFFLLIAFVSTGSMMMFLNHLQVDYGNIRESAILTFINILFLSLLVTIIDGICYKVMVERPLKSILTASDKLIKGDFSVRISSSQTVISKSEMSLLIDNFNKMAEELCGVETLRTDFISNVSHEMKTPLALVSNYATLLEKDNLDDEERKEYAKVIREASDRLVLLITNILKLNKLENQSIYPEQSEFDLGNQLSECILTFDAAMDRKNLELNVELEEGIYVKSDPELISLVWNNLLSNAIKFTDNGGQIGVHLYMSGNEAIVKISDTGCGISAKNGNRIFEKFYQADESHSCQGNGLGLALVKRVIDILKADISVESELGKGSTFTVKMRCMDEGKTNSNIFS